VVLLFICLGGTCKAGALPFEPPVISFPLVDLYFLLLPSFHHFGVNLFFSGLKKQHGPLI
jgi:hypothetical protein